MDEGRPWIEENRVKGALGMARRKRTKRGEGSVRKKACKRAVRWRCFVRVTGQFLGLVIRRAVRTKEKKQVYTVVVEDALL